MKTSTKAVLLSALVFPGLGHLYLRKFIPAVILIGASLVAIIYMVDQSVDAAYQVVGQIQSGAVAPDAASITAMVEQQTSGSAGLLLNIVNVLLIIFWIIGILDSYRIGRAKDKQEETN